MKPGEYFHDGPDLEINAGRPTVHAQGHATPATGRSRSARISTSSRSTGPWSSIASKPTACGSTCLSGTAIRFEPGDVKEVQLVDFAGERKVYGLNGLVMGQLDDPTVRKAAFQRLEGRQLRQPARASDLRTRHDHGSRHHEFQDFPSILRGALRADRRRPGSPGRHRALDRDREGLTRTPATRSSSAAAR